MDFPKSVPGVGLVNNQFVDEDPVNGTPGSLIPAKWGNDVTKEMLAVIQAAGLEPSEEQQDQLLKAVRKLRGGAVNFGLWQFSAAGGNPAAGRLTLNNAAPALASAVLIAESSAEALDYSPSLGMLRAGDTISIHERDAVTVSHRYRVTGPAVDNGTYRSIPVSYVSGSGGVPAVDAVLSVLFSMAAAYDDAALLGRVSALEARHRSLGDGQTWQNVLASRSNNVTYTNTSGRAILVVITTGTISTSSFAIDGVTAGSVFANGTTGGNLALPTYLIPNGSTYRFTSANPAGVWLELR